MASVVGEPHGVHALIGGNRDALRCGGHPDVAEASGRRRAPDGLPAKAVGMPARGVGGGEAASRFAELVSLVDAMQLAIQNANKRKPDERAIETAAIKKLAETMGISEREARKYAKEARRLLDEGKDPDA